jgi:NAD(P)-dependent dehydrogenase (short-subunit alcohol dehydrogenase family)
LVLFSKKNILLFRASIVAAFIITGGFGVLGRAVAAAARTKGWAVALVDVGANAPDDLSADHVSHFPATDLLDAAATQSVFEAIAERHHGVGALANVAGGFAWAHTEQASPDLWQRMYALNVLTAVNASRAALPALRKARGSIVNVGAFGALRAAGGMGPYAAAKSGVHRLTEALAEELRDSGVRVNAVLPSIIDTPANRRDMPDADASRWVAPADLAEIVVFLASDAARAINAVLLPVTG